MNRLKPGDLLRHRDYEKYAKAKALIEIGVPVAVACRRESFNRLRFYRWREIEKAWSANRRLDDRQPSEKDRATTNYDTASPLAEVRTSTTEQDDERATA